MELLEREQSLEALQHSLKRVASGEGHCCFVTGEAGIGKSSVVRKFVEQVADRHNTYLALCDALFTPRPLGPLYDLAPQINESMAAAIQNDSRTDIFSRFTSELTKQPGVSIIVIEDVHWADEATLDYIKFFARRIQQTRCLLILTYRDNEIVLQHPLKKVLADLPTANYTRIQLLPLTKELVDGLATAKNYSGDLFRITGGNPFYVTELLAAYHKDIPESVRDSILALYNKANEKTRDAWDILSVSPDGLPVDLFHAFGPGWQEALEPCIAENIILFRNNRIVFKHELFRIAVESSFSPFKRINLNKKVLDHLLPYFIEQNLLEEIVHYAKNAAENKLVVQYAPLAAKKAAIMGAHIQAARLYLAAIEFSTDKNDPNLVELYEAYTYECYLTNQIKEAIIYQTRALRIWESRNEELKVANALRFLSRLWWYDGHRKQAEIYSLQAIRAFESLPPSSAKAMAYSNFSQLCMLKEDVEACIEWGTKAADMAKSIGDNETLCHAMNNMGTVRYKVFPSVEGKETILDSLDIALKNSYHEHAARAYANLISCSVGSKQYIDARKYLEEGINYCEERDLQSWAIYNKTWKARLLLEQGEWEQAITLANNLLENPDYPGIVRVTAFTVAAVICMRRGEAGAMEYLQKAKEIAFEAYEHMRIIPVINACLEYEWLSGKEIINTEELNLALSFIQQVDNRWLNSDSFFWMKKARNKILPLEQLFEPVLLWKEGEFDKAAQYWRELGCPYETALMFASGNEISQRESLSILHDLGADAVIHKLKQEMRRSGVKKIPRGLRSSTKMNPGQLTNRELDILQLLKTGAANKDIAASLYISPKTVDHHISSILFKLDVPSRVKAVSEAEKLGILK